MILLKPTASVTNVQNIVNWCMLCTGEGKKNSYPDHEVFRKKFKSCGTCFFFSRPHATRFILLLLFFLFFFFLIDVLWIRSCTNIYASPVPICVDKILHTILQCDVENTSRDFFIILFQTDSASGQTCTRKKSLLFSPSNWAWCHLNLRRTSLYLPVGSMCKFCHAFKQGLLHHIHSCSGWKFIYSFYIVKLSRCGPWRFTHDFNLVNLSRCWICGNLSKWLFHQQILDFLSKRWVKKYW